MIFFGRALKINAKASRSSSITCLLDFTRCCHVYIEYAGLILDLIVKKNKQNEEDFFAHVLYSMNIILFRSISFLRDSNMFIKEASQS